MSGIVSIPQYSPCVYLHRAGSGTYTTSSLSTKTTTASDPPNICKVKPQQLQGGSLSASSSSSSSSSFSQLGCVPPLLPQQQQTPQVYVSQSAAGERNKTLNCDFGLLKILIGLYTFVHPTSSSQPRWFSFNTSFEEPFHVCFSLLMFNHLYVQVLQLRFQLSTWTLATSSVHPTLAWLLPPWHSSKASSPASRR